MDELNHSHHEEWEKDSRETISLETDAGESPTISSYRVELVRKTLQNLLRYSKFVQVEDPCDAKYKLLVTSKSSLKNEHAKRNVILITCGVVYDNPLNKKISQVLAQDYIDKRCNDMQLMSIHRYGIRAKNSDVFKQLVEKLGRHAVILDLLEVKSSSAVMLASNPNQAFILYNSARLETLMEKFEAKVEEGYYEKLSAASEVDFSLLKGEEEWQLLKHLLLFPTVVHQSICKVTEGRISLHFIHKYLSELVKMFSIYYRRVRVLTDNRSQLILVLNAKIHFLRAVQKVFNETLSVFNIEPIAFM